MEIRIKDENKIKESRGPELEQKWGILKYLSAEISFEKSEIIQGQMTCVSDVLGQKLGYDRCPDWSKRLKYKVHHFWPKMLWMLVMQYECKTTNTFWLGR